MTDWRLWWLLVVSIVSTELHRASKPGRANHGRSFGGHFSSMIWSIDWLIDWLNWCFIVSSFVDGGSGFMILEHFWILMCDLVHFVAHFGYERYYKSLHQLELKWRTLHYLRHGSWRLLQSAECRLQVATGRKAEQCTLYRVGQAK